MKFIPNALLHTKYGDYPYGSCDIHRGGVIAINSTRHDRV
jgi:hypothetical protein